MTFKFELSEQEANLLLQALSQMPYSAVYQLIQKLQAQAAAQAQEES